MIVPLLMLVLGIAAQPAPDASGSIEGIVVNGTRDKLPLAGAEVVLRSDEYGVLMPVGQTVADDQGRFVFEELPVRPGLVYVPGANHGGVHYPGPRVRLDSGSPSAHVMVTAFDAVAAPSPLVAARHDMEVHRQPHALQVTETLVVKNPTLGTYVGQADADGALVTLALAVPETFDRVTFAKEFHGRRFRIVDHRVVTDIPWPPGQRELKFTYHVPIGEGHSVFERPLDLRCSNVHLLLRDQHAEKASSNLPRAERSNRDLTVFESIGPTLPAGHVVRLEFGGRPFPWQSVGRGAALTVLLALIVLTVAAPRLRKLRARWALEAATSAADRPGRKTSRRSIRERRGGRRGSDRRAA